MSIASSFMFCFYLCFFFTCVCAYLGLFDHNCGRLASCTRCLFALQVLPLASLFFWTSAAGRAAHRMKANSSVLLLTQAIGKLKTPAIEYLLAESFKRTKTNLFVCYHFYNNNDNKCDTSDSTLNNNNSNATVKTDMKASINSRVQLRSLILNRCSMSIDRSSSIRRRVMLYWLHMLLIDESSSNQTWIEIQAINIYSLF